MWVQKIKNTKTKLPNSHTEILIKLNGKDKPMSLMRCKDFYWFLINQQNHIPKSIQKWHKQNLNNIIDNKWSDIFKLNFTLTRDTRLQSFQYRINHRIIACNVWLEQLKIKESNLCTYCQIEKDTIQHFFLHCPMIKQFWISFSNWWTRIPDNSTILLSVSTENDELNILFGFPGGADNIVTLNFCISYAKYYIYLQKMNSCNNIDFYSFLSYLKEKLEIEKDINQNRDTTQKFKIFMIIYESL